MKISACMIVKNEEENILNCIKSFKEYMTEIIVVDTGSTDRTIELAEQMGAKVYSIPWQEDFAATKNYAIAKAQGDWILFLDADEYFSKQTMKKAYQWLKKYYCNYDAFLSKMINIDVDDGNKELDFFYTVRFFRNTSNIRYEGAIHEQLCKADGNLQIIQMPAEVCTIYHTGYSSQRIRAKCERNLKYLLIEEQQGKVNSTLYYHMAECYAGLALEEDCLRCARLAISDESNTTYQSRIYHLYLLNLKKLEPKNTEEFLIVLKKALAKFPLLPDFRAEYGLYFYNQGNFVAAQREFRQAIDLYEKYQGNEPTFLENHIDNLRFLLEDSAKKSETTVFLSACAIVKNEEKNIVKWLEGMKQVADEIVVVDTGSTDQTVEIAMQAGAKVYHYQWNQDFAAAKNWTISKAHGKWILFLDADELFSEDTIKSLREKLLEDARADILLCQMINVDENGRICDRFYQTRIFRNLPEIRYAGRIHEYLISQTTKKIKLEKAEDIVIYHRGYQADLIQEKAKRNLEILLADIAMYGENPRYYAYLCDAYFILKKYVDVIKYAKLHLLKGEKSLTGESRVYQNYIAALEKLAMPIEQILVVCNQAIDSFPDLPDFYAFRAEQLLKVKCYAEVIRDLDMAIACDEKQNTGFHFSSFSANFAAVYTMYTKAYQGLNQKREMEIYMEKALEQNKYNLDLFMIFYDSVQMQSTQERIEALRKFYAEDKRDISFIVQALEICKIDEVYFYYAGKMREWGLMSEDHIERKKMLADSKYEAVYQNILQSIGIKLQLFFVLLLCADDKELIKTNIEKLPQDLQKIIFAYYENRPIDHSSYALYKNLLVRVIEYGTDMVIGNYLELVNMMDDDIQLEISEILQQNLRYNDALKQLSKIKTKNVFIQKGICYFYLNDRERASFYFKKAIESDEVSSEQLEYLIWICKGGTEQ